MRGSTNQIKPPKVDTKKFIINAKTNKRVVCSENPSHPSCQGVCTPGSRNPKCQQPAIACVKGSRDQSCIGSRTPFVEPPQTTDGDDFSSKSITTELTTERLPSTRPAEIEKFRPEM